jgi:hypothetical protein
MNSEQLVAIDDSDLDQVAGGLGISIGIDSRLLGQAGAGLSFGLDGIKGSLTLFGKKLEAGIGLFFGIKDA